VIANFEGQGAITPTLSFRLEDFTVSKPHNLSVAEKSEKSPSHKADETFDTNEASAK